MTDNLASNLLTKYNSVQQILAPTRAKNKYTPYAVHRKALAIFEADIKKEFELDEHSHVDYHSDQEFAYFSVDENVCVTVTEHRLVNDTNDLVSKDEWFSVGVTFIGTESLAVPDAEHATYFADFPKALTFFLEITQLCKNNKQHSSFELMDVIGSVYKKLNTSK